MSEHYDSNYYEWQKSLGEFGGWAELIKFERYINPEMNVVDFGCGGGFLLKNINCKEKIGVDINEVARQNAGKLGIRSFKSADDIPNNWADCIISNHALEHVSDPMQQILLLKEKLKVGGKMIFVVPYDAQAYKPNDINRHLFSWSPMNLGNLFDEAGLKVIESRAFIHKWPPLHFKIAKLFGKAIFHLSSRVYGYLKRSQSSQTRVICERI